MGGNDTESLRQLLKPMKTSIRNVDHKHSPLTVVVLTCNRCQFLREALQAISQQTYRDFVVKVLDNASTDGTKDVVEAFLQDKRFEYVRHPKNIGAAGNYNYALTHCDTKYLLITHDDDRMKPDMLNQELAVLLKHPDINLVSCENDHINANGKVLINNLYSQMYKLGEHYFQGRYDFLLGYIKGQNQISCPTAMIRISAVREAGLKFREDLEQPADTIFWMELNCLPGRFAFIGQSLYEYRLHDGQDSSRNVLQTYVALRTPVWDILLREGFKSHLREWKKWIDVLIVQTVIRLVQSTVPHDKRLLRLLREKALGRGIMNIRLRCAFLCAIFFPGEF